MTLCKRWEFVKMPLLWLWRGCFDWQAARVVWHIALFGKPPQPTGKRKARVSANKKTKRN